ncbi:MAG: hypothetical protein M3N28_00300 [Actinomycetota bacterium]|nr:hypothetical protein [Actinomycetota bacterium]
MGTGDPARDDTRSEPKSEARPEETLTPPEPTLGEVEEILLPRDLYGRLVAHARRKLTRRYFPGEEREPKAYGLLGARLSGGRAELTSIFPLTRNLRYRPDVKAHLDQLMEETAFPSETPLHKRGWVADPAEVLAAQRACDETGAALFGSYHMHRVAWEHDPRRDGCTAVDTRLAADSGMWVLILSMVDPRNPTLRAFYEARNDAERPIHLMPGTEL